MKNRMKVLRRDENKCYICGRITRLHVHHIHSRRSGGNDNPKNLITLCSGCHMSVESGNIEKAVFSCVKRALNNISIVIEEEQPIFKIIDITLTDKSAIKLRRKAYYENRKKRLKLKGLL